MGPERPLNVHLPNPVSRWYRRCGVRNRWLRRQAGDGPPVQELLLAGLKKLEYRGYDSAGISVIAEDHIEAVRAVGNLDALQAKLDGAQRSGRAAAARRRVALAVRPGHHRHRPHPLGHARARQRGERPPPLRQRRSHPRRRQRDRRELHGAARSACVARGLRLHLRDRRRGDRAPDRRPLRRRPRRRRARRLRRARGPLRVRGDEPRRARDAGRGAHASARSWSAAARRSSSSPPPCPPSSRRPAPCSTSKTARSSCSPPTASRSTTPDGARVRARDRDRRLGRGDRREGRLSRRSCSRRSTNRPTPSPRRSPTAPPAGTASDLDEQGALDEALLAGVERIVIVACGTSYHAGLIGRYAIEEWARIPVEMDVASEYRYRNPVVGPGDLVIGISQSGETADTLAAMRLARERGATVLAITNVMGSQATRDADGVLFTRAGLGDRRGRHQDVRLPGRRPLPPRPAPRRAARHACEPARIAELVGEVKRLPHCIAEITGSTTDRSPPTPWSRRSGASPTPSTGRGVLPLHRPPRRPAGRAGGRAEAQGDLLHRHRRLRRRGDEARPDRAARRVHARGLRRHRLARAGEGCLQHAGGPRPRRPRDRHHQRGQRADRRARRRRDRRCPRSTGCSSRSSP